MVSAGLSKCGACSSLTRCVIDAITEMIAHFSDLLYILKARLRADSAIIFSERGGGGWNLQTCQSEAFSL